LVSLKKNEKTSNRIPFPVFIAGRVEMRYLPIERSGKNPKLCVGKPGRTGESPDRMGAWTSHVAALSKVDYHGRQSPFPGAVSLVEGIRN
jgi:hypothetical protein